MDRNDNVNNSRTSRSFAGSHPELSGNIPDSFRHAPNNRRQFDHARDPLIAQQLRAMRMSEYRRREETGRDSEMIKLHKPFPELRPKHEKAPLRDSFNKAWMHEHREAHQAILERQRELEREEQANADRQRRECLAELDKTLITQPHGPER